MKHSKTIIIATILLTSILSCKKKGCTDCNASNFDIEAKKDDKSCQFVNGELLGFYVVHDSITGPPTMDWYHDSYDVELSRAECSPNNFKISNYANKNNNFSGVNFNVACQITNDIIKIIEQKVNEDNVRSNIGYFFNDSIYFAIEYENEFGEVFYGSCFGKKK